MSKYTITIGNKEISVNGKTFASAALVFVAWFAFAVAALVLVSYCIYTAGNKVLGHGWLTLLTYAVLFFEIKINGEWHSVVPKGKFKDISSGTFVLLCAVITVLA